MRMSIDMLLFLNIGTPELLLILLAALLLFGGDKLPEVAKGLGKGIREFKDASENVKREIHRNMNEVKDDLDENQPSKKIETSTKQETDQTSLK